MEPTRWWEAANESSRQNAGSATWPHQAAWDEVATRGEPEKELGGLSADLKDGGAQEGPSFPASPPGENARSDEA